MSVRWPPILMYHAVARVPEDPNEVCVTPERFVAQMRHIERLGLRGVCMRELVRAMNSKGAGGLVGLTFDDGYENFLHSALPVLERFGFSATVFVVGGMLGKENSWDRGPRMKLLEAAGLREVAERGVEVGCHGSTHVRLSGLEPELLEREVSESRSVLSEALGEEVEGFCYPYGSLDSRAVQVVRRTGYTYACAYKEQVFRGLHDLPRTYAGEKDGALKLTLKLQGFARYAGLLRGP